MSDLSVLLPVPPSNSINTGLHSAQEATMLAKFGRPGALSAECSEITNNALKHRIITRNLGHFSVTGLDVAVHDLEAIFEEVRQHRPDVFNAVRTEGMLCCRARRGNPNRYSNHSWGTAIDLYCGDGVVPYGDPHTQAGVLYLYFHFHSRGWYWGAGFSGNSVDSMHFELSEERIRQLHEL